MKAPRCQCGCNLPTAGGAFRPGHAARVGRHWAHLPSRDQALLGSAKWRREHAYRLLERGETNHDFTPEYFAMFASVRLVRPDAELEVIVKADTYRVIDVGIPALCLGFELDGGHRYQISTAEASQRDRALLTVGWSLVHCKSVPSKDEVEEIVAQRAIVAGKQG